MRIQKTRFNYRLKTEEKEIHKLADGSVQKSRLKQQKKGKKDRKIVVECERCMGHGGKF